MKSTETYTTKPTKENIENLEKDFKYVHAAQDGLVKKLFGFIPELPGDYVVERNAYIKAMYEVEQDFQLGEGDPRLVLFIVEQLSRSSKIVDSPKSSTNRKNK